jgi:hypothetical protein
MKTRLVIVVIVSLGICGLLAGSCHKSPNQSRILFPHADPEIVYVAPGGTGDGSREAPLGSIQEAAALTQNAPGGRVVFLASGDYDESIDVAGEIHIFGSRDPSDHWNLSTNTTTIRALSDSALPVTYAIRISSADTVTLENLSIVSQDALIPGQSSHALVIENCHGVFINSCVVESGIGADGLAGLQGQPGQNGDPGSSTPWIRPSGGQNPVPGGDGGFGGPAPTYPASSTGTAGRRGYCFGGDTLGGLPGGPGENGLNGDSGMTAQSGAGGMFSVSLASNSGWYTFVGDTGRKGVDGQEYGCGGGGGGGGSGESSRWGSYAGAPGGGGGAGGGPGSGGSGGGPGGSSIGVIAYSSGLVVRQSTITSKNGGAGGAGGMGGIGMGGQGGPTDYFPVPGGRGGNGGNGSRGGHGGGGAGGASAAIVKYKSTIDYDKETKFVIGKGGTGGGDYPCKGQGGPNGLIWESH